MPETMLEEIKRRGIKEWLAGKWRVLWYCRILRKWWRAREVVLRSLYITYHSNNQPTMTYKVHEFDYNGFGGTCNKNVIVSYTATFMKWTVDPGITLCNCSDGKTRYIPTYALKGFEYYRHPEQKKTGVMFGYASKS